jgi:hypothetical protein
MEEDKERIRKNIKLYKDKIRQEKNNKEEILLKRFEEVRKKNQISNSNKIKEIMAHHIEKDPLESIDFNSKPLIPIIKDNIYNYVNNYNFDRYKILFENEEDRLKLSKSVNLKINNHALNKKKHMDSIKKLFGERNMISREKTENIFKQFKQSNIDLRNKMNLEKAKKYYNFLKYMEKKEMDNEEYNDILNNKRLIAKEKYDNYFRKKDEQILKRIKDLKYGRLEEDYSDPYKNAKTINDKNEKRMNINSVKNIGNVDVKKMQKFHDENVVKLNIEKENNIREILDKQNRYFAKDNNKKNIFEENKKNMILNKVNNKIEVENKLNDAKLKYDRNYKSEIIYKKY